MPPLGAPTPVGAPWSRPSRTPRRLSPSLPIHRLQRPRACRDRSRDTAAQGPVQNAFTGAAGITTGGPRPGVTLTALCFWLWLLGATIYAARLVLANWTFDRRLRGPGTPLGAELLETFDECRREMGVPRAPELRLTDAVESPALFGFWRCRLLAPRTLVGRLTRAEWRHVFLHELAHVRRGGRTNRLVPGGRASGSLVQSRGLARAAPDAGGAGTGLRRGRAGPRRQPRGHRLRANDPEAARRRRPPSRGAGTPGNPEDKRLIRQRIARIARFQPPSRRPVLAAVLMIGMALTFLTDAKSPLPPKAPQPRPINQGASPADQVTATHLGGAKTDAATRGDEGRVWREAGKPKMAEESPMLAQALDTNGAASANPIDLVREARAAGRPSFTERTPTNRFATSQVRVQTKLYLVRTLPSGGPSSVWPFGNPVLAAANPMSIPAGRAFEEANSATVAPPAESSAPAGEFTGVVSPARWRDISHALEKMEGVEARSDRAFLAGAGIGMEFDAGGGLARMNLGLTLTLDRRYVRTQLGADLDLRAVNGPGFPIHRRHECTIWSGQTLLLVGSTPRDDTPRSTNGPVGYVLAATLQVVDAKGKPWFDETRPPYDPETLPGAQPSPRSEEMRLARLDQPPLDEVSDPENLRQRVFHLDPGTLEDALNRFATPTLARGGGRGKHTSPKRAGMADKRRSPSAAPLKQSPFSRLRDYLGQAANVNFGGAPRPPAPPGEISLGGILGTPRRDLRPLRPLFFSERTGLLTATATAPEMARIEQAVQTLNAHPNSGSAGSQALPNRGWRD